MSNKEEKDENVKEKKSKKKKDSSSENTKNKKLIKIVVAVVAVIIIIGVGAFFGYRSYLNNKSVGSDWGDTYYNFILESKSEDNKNSKIHNKSKIEFIEVPDIDDPVMIVNYEKEEEEYSDIYFINNGEVKNIIALESSEVEMLYNLSEKEYNWYIHTSTEEEEKYTILSSTIHKEVGKKETTEEKTTEYIYKAGEEISVETVDGSKITMSKFDSEFVEVDVDVDTIDYNKDLSDKELKESLTTGVEKYKTNEEIATEKVKSEVSKKEQEVTTKKEEMKKAEEEVQKKKEEEARKAEEERKRAEEEAKKGLKVGSYTLKYGTYAGEPDGPTAGETFVLKQNGQCEYNGASCTYTVGSHDFSQDITPHYHDCLVINTGRYTRHLYPYNASRIGDGDLESYDYKG